jgi:RNA polymerase sigma-32 factor
MISMTTKTADTQLSSFLGEARKFPILEAEEERELVRRWREEEDNAALTKLIGSHLRLVIKHAFRNSGYGLPVADLISEGSAGLMQAVERFDTERGFRFSTYAQWWIRAAMQEYILRSTSVVRMGTTAAQKKLFFNLRRLKSTLNAYEEGDLPAETVRTIASELEVPEDVVIEMNRRMSTQDQSLNVPVGGEGDLSHLDLLPSDDEDPESELLASDEFRKRWDVLQDAMGSLSERERHIVTERKLKEPAKTLEQLSVVYGISRERVRQIEANAMGKLQKAVAATAAACGLEPPAVSAT